MAALAQDNYPTRPVKIIIAFPVGGLLDTVSRVVGEKLTGLLGQQFIIEARPGAGGTIATAAVAKAEPDGYTIMMINDNHALNPSVFKNVPYDSVKDFAPIGFVGSTPLVLPRIRACRPRTSESLVALAKEKPGTITYGSVGLGSASHLAGEMFEQRRQRQAAAHSISRRRAGDDRPARRSRQYDILEPCDPGLKT